MLSVCKIVNAGCKDAKRMEPFRYPMANVLQSAEGAIAVTGSKIVRADTCSLVAGSNRISSPFSLPVMVSSAYTYRIARHTKCQITVTHPCRCRKRLI